MCLEKMRLLSVYSIDKLRVDDRSPVLTKSSSFHFCMLLVFCFLSLHKETAIICSYV